MAGDKKAKPRSHWINICNRLARGELISGRGWKPPRGEWLEKIEQIQKCGVTRRIREGSGQSTLSFSATTTPTCICNWDHVQSKPSAALPNVTATTAEQQQPRRIEFGILKPPNARKHVKDVRGMYKVYQSPGYYDLEVFGYCDGKCPHCKGAPNKNPSRLGVVKLIHTLGKPRFVQGIGMTCSNPACEGWQSHEKTYVDTLPFWKQKELNAVIVKKCNGVDMSLIMQMRIGVTAATIENTCRSNLQLEHAALEAKYDEKCKAQRQLGVLVEDREFPQAEDKYVAKASIVVRAFMRDYLTQKDPLLREMASLKTEHTMAIDHQFKVVSRAVGKNARCSFLVVGDGGIVLGYYAVPDDSLAWTETAMKEIVARHGTVLDGDLKTRITPGDLPEVIYVDKLCCNGMEGERSVAMRTFFGMIKKLDAFHLIQRIGKEINGEHPRKGDFLRRLSECIFTAVEEDVKHLESAREKGNIRNLSSKEKKVDKMKYVRTVIQKDTKMIVSKILVIVKGQIALDREAKIQSINAGDLLEDITTAHPAFPLITKKILKCVMNQCIHILNGCVHDEIPMNLEMGQAYYRGTHILLDFFKSLRGSSKVEAVHSFLDRKVYASNSMRELLLDARLHWFLTNYNRQRLKDMGMETLVQGVSPSEVNTKNISIVESTNLLFGFGYYHRVTKEFDEHAQDAVLDELETALEEVEITDILDDDDDASTDLEEDDDDEAARSESDSDDEVSYNDLLQPLITKDIPDSVDFTELKQLEGTLSEDVKWTTLHNPFAQANPIDNTELQREINARTTFAECVEHSNTLAAEGGIDIIGHNFESTNVERFNATRQVSSRRNVQSRTQRGRDAVPVPVDYNEDMERIFLELWAKGKNPSSGAGVRKWINEASVEYEKRRTELIIAAEKDILRDTPSLMPVAYNAIKDWVDKMKERSSAPLRDGAFTPKSSELSSQMKTFAPSASPLKDLPTGTAIKSSTLQVAVPTAAHASGTGNKFESPTSSKIERLMPKPKPRKRKNMEPGSKRLKKTSGPDSIDSLRKKTAATKMVEHGIVQDPVDSNLKRCAICGKYISKFIFEGMKHVRSINGKPFCPLADNPALYVDYQTKKSERKVELNRQNYLSRKDNM